MLSTEHLDRIFQHLFEQSFNSAIALGSVNRTCRRAFKANVKALKVSPEFPLPTQLGPVYRDVSKITLVRPDFALLKQLSSCDLIRRRNLKVQVTEHLRVSARNHLEFCRDDCQIYAAFFAHPFLSYQYSKTPDQFFNEEMILKRFNDKKKLAAKIRIFCAKTVEECAENARRSKTTLHWMLELAKDAEFLLSVSKNYKSSQILEFADQALTDRECFMREVALCNIGNLKFASERLLGSLHFVRTLGESFGLNRLLSPKAKLWQQPDSTSSSKIWRFRCLNTLLKDPNMHLKLIQYCPELCAKGLIPVKTDAPLAPKTPKRSEDFRAHPTTAQLDDPRSIDHIWPHREKLAKHFGPNLLQCAISRDPSSVPLFTNSPHQELLVKLCCAVYQRDKRNARHFGLTALKVIAAEDPMVMAYMNPAHLRDLELAKIICRHYPFIAIHFNRDQIRELIAVNWRVYFAICPRMQSDLEVALIAWRQNPCLAYHFDRSLIERALEIDWRVIIYSRETLRDDPALGLQAWRIHRQAAHYLGRNALMVAIEIAWEIFCDASPLHRGDFELAKRAWHRDRRSANHFAPNLMERFVEYDSNVFWFADDVHSEVLLPIALKKVNADPMAMKLFGPKLLQRVLKTDWVYFEWIDSIWNRSLNETWRQSVLAAALEIWHQQPQVVKCLGLNVLRALAPVKWQIYWNAQRRQRLDLSFAVRIWNAHPPIARYLEPSILQKIHLLDRAVVQYLSPTLLRELSLPRTINRTPGEILEIIGIVEGDLELFHCLDQNLKRHPDLALIFGQSLDLPGGVAGP